VTEIVINQLGPAVSELIRDTAPQVEIVEVPPGELPPDGLHAEILFAPGRAPGRESERGSLSELCGYGVRWVHVAGAGADGIPPEVFGDNRIVTASKGGKAGPIAEFVLGSMLAFEKRFPLTWVQSPPGGWGFPPLTQTEELVWEAPPRWGFSQLGILERKTLGLVGLGGIAQAVARRALPFEMNVVALRRRPDPSPIPEVALAQSLEELLSVSDHLVVAAASTANTRHLLNAETLAHVKRGVHVINVSRGSLVDQDALLEALEDGRVGFASLDVTEPEPLPEGHPLYAHPRVHVSPHVSGSTPDGNRHVVELFLENLRRYIDGEPLAGVVDPAEGY